MKPLYLKENYLNQNETCEIFENYAPSKILSYIIKNNNINQKNIKHGDNNKIDVKNIKKYINDIPLLLSKNNNENNSYNLSGNLNKKNYFNIEPIKKELNEVKKRNFLERKKKVENGLKIYDDKKDFEHNYIFLLELLINDNTNKDLLKKYLTLLKEKGDELKKIFNNNFEEFNDEFKLFSKVFTLKDKFPYFNPEVKSQKDEFCGFLENISNLKKDKEIDIKKFENYLKECDNYFETFSYFNLPTDVSNEELFYFRNLNLIKYHLKDIYDRIKKEIERQIKDVNISTNFLSEKEKKEKIELYKKDLLKSELDKINTNIKLCFDDLKKSNDFKLINDLVISLNFAEDKLLFDCCYKYITSSNKNIDEILLQNKDNEYITNLFTYIKKVNIDLNLIKTFYKNILPLKCFKSIFLTLNGEDSFYPLEDKEFTDYFIENSLEILDVPILDSIELNDKFTMKSYFVPFISQIVFKNYLHFMNEINIIQNGFFVSVGYHGIGHNFTNFNFYMENCKIPIETPRKKNFEDCGGGYYVDFALFGKKLEEISLEQVLYILNEKNYEKTYLDFQYGFNNIKQEDLQVEGVFKEMCQNIANNLKDFENNEKSICISFNPSNIKENKIFCDIGNDLLYGSKI